MSNQSTLTREQNGVDVTSFLATLKAIGETPDIAQFRFRATNRWIDGAQNRSMIQGFYGACQEDTSRSEPFVFDNDEPPILLGANRGANPVEFVLHGLAGCITTTFIYNAAVRGIEIKRVETELEGDIDLHGMLALDPDVRPGYQEIRVRMHVEGDASPEQLKELVDFAKNHSPVFSTVSMPVPVKVEINAV